MADQVQRGHGGDWTRLKLDCIEEYFRRYMDVMKFQKFHKIYIDAFSGTGEPYKVVSGSIKSEQQRLEIAIEIDKPQEEFFDGSVRRALAVPNGFNSFRLIERRRKNVSKLLDLAGEPQNSSRDIQILSGDANDEILRLCKTIDWHAERGRKMHRAVLFLDPFGCQVDWATIEAVARTQAIDMWYLFPSGWLNRLLPRSGKIPPEWEACLDRCLGSPDWRDEFFEEQRAPTLFDFDAVKRNKTASIASIEQYFIKRLKTVFSAVNQSCVPIENMQGYQMFSLCFAAGNPTGAGPAGRIASHLIKIWSERRR